MLTRTATRNLLKVFGPLKAVSPFTIFIKENAKKFPLRDFARQKTHKARISARGKAMADAYRKIRGKAKIVLIKKAERANYTVKRKRNHRKAVAFAKFVRDNCQKVRKLPVDRRLKALAKIWHANKAFGKREIKKKR